MITVKTENEASSSGLLAAVHVTQGVVMQDDKVQYERLFGSRRKLLGIK